MSGALGVARVRKTRDRLRRGRVGWGVIGVRGLSETEVSSGGRVGWKKKRDIWASLMFRFRLLTGMKFRGWCRWETTSALGVVVVQWRERRGSVGVYMYFGGGADRTLAVPRPECLPWPASSVTDTRSE